LAAAAVTFVGALIGMLKLPMPRVTPEAGRRFRIGAPEDFTPGTERVIRDRNVLIRATDQGLAAISLICTHLGCVVVHREDGFHCPCHGSRFDQAGRVLGGPAPRPLPWFDLSQAADGSLVVDAGREVPPGTFRRV
jgi:Rieske Fe-S protein